MQATSSHVTWCLGKLLPLSHLHLPYHVSSSHLHSIVPSLSLVLGVFSDGNILLMALFGIQ